MELNTNELVAIQTELEIAHWNRWRLKIVYHGFIPPSFLYTIGCSPPPLLLCLWLWGIVAELFHAQGYRDYTLFRTSRKVGSWETVFHSTARLGKEAYLLVMTMLKVTVMQEKTLIPKAKKLKAELGKRSGLKLKTAKSTRLSDAYPWEPEAVLHLCLLWARKCTFPNAGSGMESLRFPLTYILW